MSNRSLLTRLFTLVVVLGLMATSMHAQEAGVEGGEAEGEAAMEAAGKKDDTYQDKKPEEIDVEQIILRRRQTLLAQQWMAEGLERFNERKFKEAIDKYTQAETILKQISKSSKAVVGDLDEVRARLATTYHAYAKQLIEQARTDIDISHFEKAKNNIAKAIEYDKTLKPQAQKLLKRIEQLRIVIEIQERTDPEVIDPEYQERIKEILIKKAEAKVFLDHNVWKRARDAYEDVLLKDPTDEDAVNGLRHLYETLQAAAQIRRRAQEAERMAEIEWKWIDPIPPRESTVPGLTPDAEAVPREASEAALGIRQKLKSIIITKISFEDTPVTTVFDFLKTRSRELDPEGVGVNFLVILKSRAAEGAAPEENNQGGGGGGGEGWGDDDDAWGDDDDAWGDDDDAWGDDDDAAGGAAAGGGAAAPAAPAAGFEEPTITMDFDNIPLAEAIRYICEGAGLKYKVEEHAVVILGPGVSRGELELRFFPIDPRLFTSGGGDDDDDAAGGVDFKRYFEEKGVTFPTTDTGQNASISYDRGTSKLIVRNTPENLRLIEMILREINRAIPQVTIEAKFVEVRQDSLEELSFQWMFMGSPPPNPKAFQFYGDSDPGEKEIRVNPGALQGTLRNLLGDLTPEVFNIDTIIGNTEFKTMIYWFDRKGGTDILSAPKVTVQSGKEAFISMIEERRFPESFEEPEIDNDNENDNTTIQPSTPVFGEPREDLGITLTVTPQVAQDGISIALELHPKVVEFIGYDTTFNSDLNISGNVVPLRYDTPIFEVREIRTEVTVWDGETVVLGGSIRDNLQKVNDKVPILGDLPLVGRLFQSKGEFSEKKNLLMFVSARIVDPSGLPRREHDIRGIADFRR